MTELIAKDGKPVNLDEFHLGSGNPNKDQAKGGFSGYSNWQLASAAESLYMNMLSELSAHILQRVFGGLQASELLELDKDAAEAARVKSLGGQYMWSGDCDSVNTVFKPSGVQTRIEGTYGRLLCFLAEYGNPDSSAKDFAGQPPSLEDADNLVYDGTGSYEACLGGEGDPSALGFKSLKVCRLLLDHPDLARNVASTSSNTFYIPLPIAMLFPEIQSKAAEFYKLVCVHHGCVCVVSICSARF
jgi:hypothetical protein